MLTLSKLIFLFQISVAFTKSTEKEDVSIPGAEKVPGTMLNESICTIPDAVIFFFLIDENCAFVLRQDNRNRRKNIVNSPRSNTIVYGITIFAQNLLLKKLISNVW